MLNPDKRDLDAIAVQNRQVSPNRQGAFTLLADFNFLKKKFKSIKNISIYKFK
jgi:hypothetical protein